MTAYEARVYDLDGTIVRLAVDWERVRDDVLAVYRDAGIDIDPETGLWDLLLSSATHGIDGAIENEIARHERRGARRSERLPMADALPTLTVPVAVCSLNAEEACRIALETHDVIDYVDAIVGRDSVSSYKPDPEPLLVAIEALSATPDRTLFIGDTETDATTARRAGVEFAHVDSLL